MDHRSTMKTTFARSSELVWNKEEELDVEVEDAKGRDGKFVLNTYSLHSAPFPFPQKMNFPEFSFYFSAVAWCARSNLVACATQTCAKYSGNNQEPVFWIPIHIYDQESATENTVFNVTAETLRDSVHFLEWSPPSSCQQALLVGTASGRVTVWTQPTRGTSNVARAVNCWFCEHEWNSGLAVRLKWLTGPSPYRFQPTTTTNFTTAAHMGGQQHPKSLEERFVDHAPRSSLRWPNFLCVCSILYSGSVQLHWRQWPPPSTPSPAATTAKTSDNSNSSSNNSSSTDSSPKWFSTHEAVLGAGPSGIFGADVIVTDEGSLIIAAAPVATPSTVVVWEISPWATNSHGGGGGSSSTSQSHTKYGMPVQVPTVLGLPPWPGFAPLAAYLLSWHDQQQQQRRRPGPFATTIGGKFHGNGNGTAMENAAEEVSRPRLQCTAISNLSVYEAPDAKTVSSWGLGVAVIAFDPSHGGSALVTLSFEGYFISPDRPEAGPLIRAWRVQRWEKSSQPLPLHPLFDSYNGSYPPAPAAFPYQTTVTSWTNVSTRVISPSGLSSNKLGTRDPIDPHSHSQNLTWTAVLEKLANARCPATVVFSRHGGEVAISLYSGEVYVLTGSLTTVIESFAVQTATNHPPAVAFSASSCCLVSVFHNVPSDCTMVKLAVLEPVALAAGADAHPDMTGGGRDGPWERHIADRFWWSVVCDLDWWDIIACNYCAVRRGSVTVGMVTAVLDADFHALPSSAHRQTYSAVLDRLKCRLLEGQEAADVKALVLDMQARLLLESLAKGVDASLVNPSTLISEPWLVSSEVLSGLGADAMSVDPDLVPFVQGYVDSILDLASHFLTRLRRYASFCRTLVSHSVHPTPPPVTHNVNFRSGVNYSSRGSQLQHGHAMGGSAMASSGGIGSTATALGGVNPWIQGAIAKMSSNGTEPPSHAAIGSGVTTPTANGLSQLTVSTATFPGIPAVRLIGDRQFLHRLCQLLFFCLIFRKRHVPRFAVGSGHRSSADSSATGIKSGAGVGAGAPPPKTEDMGGGNSWSATSGVPTNVQIEEVSKHEEAPAPAPPTNPRAARMGNGNAGYGYTADEVKYLFLVLVDLCKRTSSHPHPLPTSQVGSSNAVTRLHYVEGQYSVQPEIVETALGSHMQQLPRPRGADAAGVLMRELELQPPCQEWGRQTPAYDPWANPQRSLFDYVTEGADLEDTHEEQQQATWWPRKRRYAERDAALGLKTAIGLETWSTFFGSRRDVITGLWKTAHIGVWHRCCRCGRQTASLAAPTLASTGAPVPPSTRESWWMGRWIHGCPMCGGKWTRYY